MYIGKLLLTSTYRYWSITKQGPLSLSFSTAVGWEQKGHLRLRNATLSDLDLLRHWDNQPHLQDDGVMGDADYNEWNWEAELARSDLSWRHQLIAEALECGPFANETKAIGFVQIIDAKEEESHYWESYLKKHIHDLEGTVYAIDIWIGDVDYIGKGYGNKMMKLALDEYCFGEEKDCIGPTTVLVDPMAANTKAHRFYQKFGFRLVERHSFGPDLCFIHELTQEQWMEARRNLK